MEKANFESLKQKYLEGQTSKEEESLLFSQGFDGAISKEWNFYRSVSEMNLSSTFDKKISKSLLIGSDFNWRAIAAMLACILIGFIGGTFTNSQKYKHKITMQMENIQMALTLSLVTQPSVHQKLEALKLVNNLSTLDSDILQSLGLLINSDESTNVRLGIARILTKYSDNAQIQKIMLDAIGQQKSLIVIMQLVRGLYSSGNNEVKAALEHLIETEGLKPDAIEQIKKTIKI